MTGLQSIIQELEQQRAAINEAIEALRGLQPTAPERRPPGNHNPARPPAKRRHISEEGRRRIAEAQRQRWAAQKKAAKKNVAGQAGKKRAA